MKKLTDEDILNNCKNIRNGYVINSIVRKIIKGRRRIYLNVTCVNNHNYDVLYDNYVKAYGGGCPVCKLNIIASKNRIYKYEDLLDQAISIGYDVVGGDFVNAASVMEFKCQKCGYIKKANFKSLLDGRQCRNCIGLTKKNILEINEYVQSIDNDYSVPINQEYIDCKHKILFFHKKCSSYFETTLDSFVNKNTRCAKCNRSKMEYELSKILDAYKIRYISQMKFKDLVGVNNGKLSYDFYLPYHNILVECQGGQHLHPVNFFGGEEYFKIQKEHDKRKQEYASHHNITLIEIWNINDITNKLLTLLKKAG